MSEAYYRNSLTNYVMNHQIVGGSTLEEEYERLRTTISELPETEHNEQYHKLERAYKKVMNEIIGSEEQDHQLL